ncbi:hypothetical protein ACFL1B_04095 [Nanoarchaeota archaeon]
MGDEKKGEGSSGDEEEIERLKRKLLEKQLAKAEAEEKAADAKAGTDAEAAFKKEMEEARRNAALADPKSQEARQERLDKQQEARQLKANEEVEDKERRQEKFLTRNWDRAKEGVRSIGKRSVGADMQKFASGGKRMSLAFLFWIAILTHVYCMLYFQSGAQSYMMTYILIFVVILAVVGFMWIKDPVLVGAAALTFVGPLLISRLDFLPFQWIIIWAWMCSPLYAVRLLMISDSPWFGVWLVGIVALILLLVVGEGIIGLDNIPLLSSFQGGTIDIGNAFQKFMDAARKGIVAIYDGLLDMFRRVPAMFTQIVDYSTGGYYSGMIEDSQTEPVGLKITSFRSLGSEYWTDEPIILWADIEGKSFNKVMTVDTSCFNHYGVRGQTARRNFQVFDQTFEAVKCTFEPGALPTNNGTRTPHVIIFTASFDFSTWSYVTYTFVSQETRYNYVSQGRDINEELDIPRTLRPIFTPGPVKLGMSADVVQPVGVSSQSEQAVKTIFGLHLQNYWDDGDIVSVYDYTILIPSQFDLVDCDIEPTSTGADPLCQEYPELCARDMKAYSFTNTAKPKKFDTITCRLVSGSGSSLIPAGQQKVQHTFVAMANYRYVLEKRRKIEVEEFGVQTETTG